MTTQKDWPPSYSQTWIVNAERSLESAAFVNATNFHRFGSFAGLHERPSPFRYRARFASTAHGPTPPPYGLLRMILGALRSMLIVASDTFQAYLKSRFDQDFRQLTEVIPLKDFAQPALSSAFFNFSNKKLNGSYVKAAEQFLLLQKFISPSKPQTVCEIGAGFGAMAEIIVTRWQPARYFIIDLPPTLDISWGYLSALASKRETKYLENFEIGKWEGRSLVFGKTQIFFLDATGEDFGHVRGIDLFVNSNSFAEMNSETLLNYLDLVDRNSGSFLFSANRKRVEGKTEFDPHTFAAGRTNWDLLFQGSQTAFKAYRQNIMTIHNVRTKS